MHAYERGLHAYTKVYIYAYYETIIKRYQDILYFKRTHTDRRRQTNGRTDRATDLPTETDGRRRTETDRHRLTNRQTETERQRQTKTDTRAETDKQRQTEIGTQTEEQADTEIRNTNQ